MKKREIKVAKDLQALDLMLKMLSANMLDNELETDADGKYKIHFGWFSKKSDAQDKVGCPCFICKYHGFLPGENKMVHAIVYVKAFGARTGCMTKMHFIGDEKDAYHFNEICDGEAFVMEAEKRYTKEEFVYDDGHIVEY